MEQHTIDWRSAAVSRGAIDFELSVELEGDLSPDWEALFNESAETDGLRPQERSWSHVRLADRTIVMRELRPDGRERAHKYLDDIVSRTNAAFAAKLEEQERERIRAEQEEVELRRTAEELTAWFRSAEPPAPAAVQSSPTTRTEIGERDEAGRPLERPGLRERFLHSLDVD